jgi:hypothetical protein
MAVYLNPNPILKKAEWDQDDIHMLFKDNNDPKELWSLILSSVGAKKLQPSRVGFTRTCRYDSSLTAIDTIYFEPIALVTWAINNEFTLSIAMREWYDQQEKPKLIKEKSALSEVERNTMLKLIIGMAMDSYGYDPESRKNSATGTNSASISAKLELKGVFVNDDTIRKYLNQAKDIL